MHHALYKQGIQITQHMIINAT